MSALTVRNPLIKVLLWAAMILMVLVYAFPFIYLFLTSFKTPFETLAIPPRVVPSTWTLENYVTALQRPGAGKSFLNSTVTSLISTAVSVALAVPAAYGITRFQTRAGQALSGLALISRMIPPVAIGVPMLSMLASVNLVDTSFGLAIAQTTISLPLSILLMASFFEGVPVELEEAAKVDGCSRTRALWSVVLPIVKGGMAVTAIFAFLASWNEFLFALILTSQNAQTTPIAIANFQTQFGLDWGPMTAMAVLYSLPVIVLTILLQRHIVAGMTMGAVKG